MLSKTNLIYLPTVMLWRCLRGRWQGGDWPKRPPVVSLCLLRIARRRRSVRTQKEQRTQPTRFGINSDRFGALLQFRPRSLRRTLLPACKWLHQRRWQVWNCFLEHRVGTLIFYSDFCTRVGTKFILISKYHKTQKTFNLLDDRLEWLDFIFIWIFSDVGSTKL